MTLPTLPRCPDDIRAALTGPCPSVRPTFDRQGEIDTDALATQVEYLLAAGAKSLILTEGDSLFSVLSDDEIESITRQLIDVNAGRAKVVSATGIWWTRRAVDFAASANRWGADLVMVLPPDWGASTTLDTLVAHYAAAAEHLPVMVVTNFLNRRPRAFGLELVRRLYREIPGVISLKDDVCGDFARRICLETSARWALIAGGQKQNHMNMHPYGVDGYLSLHLAFHPEVSKTYWQAIERNDLPAARRIIADFDMPLFDYALAESGGFDAVVHGILEWRGLGERHRRPPYHTLTEEQYRQLVDFLESRPAL